jgi:large subunit ribosomal protein L18
MREKLLRKKNSLKNKRKKRVRADIFGTATLPRVTIFKSNRYIYAQAIDDVNAVTLASCDGFKLSLRANKEGAKELGKQFAQTLKDKGIEKAVFDRNGNKYHGVVASFADALRDNGIKV